MSRAEIKGGIISALLSTTILSFLGEASANNYRIYDAWPQHQPEVIIEPPQTGGWMVVDDKAEGGIRESIHEVHEIDFHILSPLFTIGEDVIDILDGIFQWNFPQQRNVVYGNFILYETRRTKTEQTFHKDFNIPQKTATYTMDFVKSPTNSG